jgi:hypothetical protein
MHVVDPTTAKIRADTVFEHGGDSEGRCLLQLPNFQMASTY